MSHSLTLIILVTLIPNLLTSPSLTVTAGTPAIWQEKEVESTAQDPKDKKPTHPELRRELLDAMKVDQDARKKLVEGMKEGGQIDSKIMFQVVQIDKKNRAWMGEVVEKHGWPGATMVGVDGAHAAWILVQHSDADLPFQKQCLELMKKMPEGEVSGKDIAYLTDRVLCAEKLPQVYGTQLSQQGDQLTPLPIKDEEHVDERRAEVGLGPLSDYLKSAAEMYVGDDEKDSDDAATEDDSDEVEKEGKVDGSKKDQSGD